MKILHFFNTFARLPTEAVLGQIKEDGGFREYGNCEVWLRVSRAWSGTKEDNDHGCRGEVEQRWAATITTPTKEEWKTLIDMLT